LSANPGAVHWMLLLALQTVSERIATFLLMLSNKAGADRAAENVVEVPISRKDMAAYLGTTVESISRAVQDMSRRGVIRIIDPQRFEIADRRRIVDMSGQGPSEFAGQRERRRLFG
jgi:CRP/FNR family transcriptional regulator